MLARAARGKEAHDRSPWVSAQIPDPSRSSLSKIDGTLPKSSRHSSSSSSSLQTAVPPPGRRYHHHRQPRRYRFTPASIGYLGTSSAWPTLTEPLYTELDCEQSLARDLFEITPSPPFLRRQSTQYGLSQCNYSYHPNARMNDGDLKKLCRKYTRTWLGRSVRECQLNPHG